MLDRRPFWIWHTLHHLGVRLDETTSLPQLVANLDETMKNASRPRTLVYDCSNLSTNQLQSLLMFWSSARLRYGGKLRCRMTVPIDWANALRFADGSKLLHLCRDGVLEISRT